ncbi:winged helix-turn-helix domain-containing protein [Streptomyces lasiicapitis]|uniref:Transcriptional regulator n=1 Tax=Streptomyces lasiicapitis TaxID=1923961 RepID=A0ABQ2LZF6_9ACTN|nr:winged helix-turn-helix domain-containing protein [Streptomyces lasiicapitis]GGO45053.1 transcriptional regulator [Streptomyces lasiicapitis]
MANSRYFSGSTVSGVSTATASSASTAAVPAAARISAPSARGRLRAVAPDEVAQDFDLADFSGSLPPGATLLPAPQHTLPTLPGRPPMIGYLVLLPAGQEHLAAGPGAGVSEQAVQADGSGPVRVDSARRAAHVDGRPLDLTYLEFELLAHLVAHPHRVHTRDQLVTTVWGYGHVGDGRTVDVHIARLRRKLGAEHRQAIQTVRRVGYKYAPPTTG